MTTLQAFCVNCNFMVTKGMFTYCNNKDSIHYKDYTVVSCNKWKGENLKVIMQ